MFILAEMGKKRLKRKNGVPTSGNERQTETDQWKKAKEIENVEKKIIQRLIQMTDIDWTVEI